MIRVYQYGLRPPTLNETLVQEQLKLAHRYYCALLEARNKERDGRRALEQGCAAEEQEAVRCQAELNRLLTEQAKIRAKARRRADPPELRVAIKDARAKRKEANTTLKAARVAMRDAREEEKKKLYDAWLEEQKRLRHASGLRHGTYTAVEDSIDQANKDTPLWDKDAPDEPKNPRFPAWNGSGRVGVQIQHGIFAELLEDCQDTRAQLSICDRTSKASYGVLRIRIGSESDRSPIWAEWPIKLHRPLPRGAQIKRIMVSARKRGPRMVWTTEMTVDVPAVAMKEKCGTGVVAVDLGWRIMGGETRSITRHWRDIDGHIRVAAWRDDQGNSGTLELYPQLIAALRKKDEIEKLRDDGLDFFKELFLAALPEELPEWLRARTVKRGERLPSSAQARAYMSQWKSQGRFAALCRAWQGDDMPPILEMWRYHDHHLWEWVNEQSAQARARRKDHYRCFAAWLTRTYGVIVLEKFDKRYVARDPNPEDKAKNKTASSSRVLSATSELENCILHAATARGAENVYVDPYRTTQDCPGCGYDQQWWDAAKSLDRKPPCPRCGWDKDQDDSACRIILKRYYDRLGGVGSDGGAREEEVPEIKESRYERRSKALRERRAAQKALANDGQVAENV